METNKEELRGEIEQLKSKLKEIAEKQELSVKIKADSELKLQHALEKIKLLALSIDESGKISYCNEYFLQFTGWKQSEVIGKDWDKILTQDENKKEDEIYNLVGKTGLVNKIKRKIYASDGSLRNVRFNIILQYTSDGI